MLVLGVGGLLHDASAALLSDGRILCAIESEKVTRHHREVSTLPVEAIDAVLREAGVTMGDVDCIVTNWKAGPWANGWYVPLILRHCLRGTSPWRSVGAQIAIAGSHTTASMEMSARMGKLPPVHRVKHHLAHVGCSYTLSPFEDAAVAIIDGTGEIDATSLYVCSGRKTRRIWSAGLPFDSLGTVYAMGTEHLGFRMLGDEYKVMALAARGERHARFDRFFADLVRMTPSGRYRIDGRLLGDVTRSGHRFPVSIQSRIGKPRISNEPLSQEHADFAKAMQDRIGDVIVELLRGLRKETGSSNLSLGGGVALNSVINGRIARETGFANVYVPPAPHDGGTAMGAAAYFTSQVLGLARPEPVVHAYLGPNFAHAEVAGALARSGMPHAEVADPAATAASLVQQGNVIGWFQGRAEFGPRALGNRSIIADPRIADHRERVGRVIKGREGFRPIAPAVLEEHHAAYFPDTPPSPFMSFVGRVAAERRVDIVAAVHVDGTARPQSISRRDNPLFHRLVSCFAEATGVPAVINTSFNVSGEPIVMKPEDAIRTFYASSLDALVIGNFMMRKSAGS